MRSPSDLVEFSLFYAIRPPRQLCLEMERFARRVRHAHRISRPVMTAPRLHNTMAPIDCRDIALESAVASAQKAGAAVRFPPFPIRYDWSGSFMGRRGNYPLVLRGNEGLAPLAGFRKQLVTEMHRVHLKTDDGFTPHITLMWGDHMVDDNPLSPFEWTVEEFVLILSVVGESRHDILDRWRLH